MHVACKKNDPTLVELLLKNKADPNAKTNIFKLTPLHYAIQHDVNPIIIFQLIKYRASMFELDNKDKKPIDYIMSDEMRRIIDLFLKGDKQMIEDNYYKLVFKTNINVLNTDKTDNTTKTEKFNVIDQSFEDFARPVSEHDVAIDKLDTEYIKSTNQQNSTMDFNNTDINTISQKQHNDTKFISLLDMKSVKSDTEKCEKKARHEKKNSIALSEDSDINLDLNQFNQSNIEKYYLF